MLCYHAHNQSTIMVSLRQFTGAQFMHTGLEIIGFDPTRQRRTRYATNLLRFRSAFGCSPEACAAIFHDIQVAGNVATRIDKPNCYFFLVAMNWLATYNKEAVMAGFFRCDEKTLRNRIKQYVEAVAGLKDEKIKWKDLTHVDERFVLSVDGVHFRINEPRKVPSANWCSHKHRSAGLGYEVGISIWHNNVVWIAGPFQPATHDKTKYQEPDGLQSRIPDGKLVIGDRGYRGEDTEGVREKRSLATRNTRDTAAVKEFKRRVRARHENFNARLKSFAILDSHFRHPRERHKTVFEAVCVICQYDMENGHPLFDV